MTLLGILVFGAFLVMEILVTDVDVSVEIAVVVLDVDEVEIVDTGFKSLTYLSNLSILTVSKRSPSIFRISTFVGWHILLYIVRHRNGVYAAMLMLWV